MPSNCQSETFSDLRWAWDPLSQRPTFVARFVTLGWSFNIPWVFSCKVIRIKKEHENIRVSYNGQQLTEELHGWALPWHLLVSAFVTVLCTKTSSDEVLGVVFINGYRYANLRSSLLFCPFIRIVVVGWLLGMWVPQRWVLGHMDSSRNVFTLVEWPLKHTQKWLVAPKTSVPLMHPWTYLVMLVIIVAHRVHNWEKLFMVVSLSSLNSTFWHLDSWHLGRQLPDHCQLDLSMSCD